MIRWICMIANSSSPAPVPPPPIPVVVQTSVALLDSSSCKATLGSLSAVTAPLLGSDGLLLGIQRTRYQVNHALFYPPLL
jgi:hypothetical protein